MLEKHLFEKWSLINMYIWGVSDLLLKELLMYSFWPPVKGMTHVLYLLWCVSGECVQYFYLPCKQFLEHLLLARSAWTFFCLFLFQVIWEHYFLPFETLVYHKMWSYVPSVLILYNVTSPRWTVLWLVLSYKESLQNLSIQ